MASAKEKELYSIKLVASRFGNETYRNKVISNYEMYSTSYEASGDLTEGKQFQNNNGDFIEIFSVSLFNNVSVKYVGCCLKGVFESWSEVKFTNIEDKKQFKATLYENNRQISVQKCPSGWYLTAYGINLYGALALLGRCVIRNSYTNLS